MGRASAAEVCEKILEVFWMYIETPKSRLFASEDIAQIFWNYDCDTLDEVDAEKYPEFHEALKRIGYCDDEDNDA